MATQQGGGPSRPWFRLATMARPPPPPPSAPTPQPNPPPLQPRPSFIRPTFSTRVAPPPQPPQAPNVPPSPSPPPSSPSSSSSSPSPSPKPSPNTEPKPRFSSPSLATTLSPPKTEQNSPPRTMSRPPSPLSLPSPKLKSNKPEYEQKTMLEQEPKEKTKSFNNGDLHRHISSFLPKTESGNKHSDSEDTRIRIITIAGENKGAIMDLTPSSKNTTRRMFGNMEKNNHSDSSDSDKSASDSKSKSKAKNKNLKPKSPMMNAVMNSNVQGVNNSILYNSSTTHHDPGVHLSLLRKHEDGRGSQLKERIG